MNQQKRKKIDLANSDEGSNRNRFREFRQEDLLNPSFREGQVFGTVELVRKAIIEYSLRNRVEMTQETMLS